MLKWLFAQITFRRREEPHCMPCPLASVFLCAMDEYVCGLGCISYWVSRLYGSDNLLMGFYSFINILLRKKIIYGFLYNAEGPLGLTRIVFE